MKTKEVIKAETEVSNGSMTAAVAVILGNMVVFWGGILYLALR